MPRKQRPKQLSEVLAGSISGRREELDWTQTDLAQKMKEEGFTTWTHTTVREVEGGGRGRRLTLAELLALSRILDRPIFDLMRPEPWEPVALAEGGEPIKGYTELVKLIISLEMLNLVGAREMIMNETERIRDINRVHMRRASGQLREQAEGLAGRAEELIKTANWLDLEVDESLHAGPAPGSPLSDPNAIVINLEERP